MKTDRCYLQSPTNHGDDWDPWTWLWLRPKSCWQGTPWEQSSVWVTNTRFAKQIKMSGGCRHILHSLIYCSGDANNSFAYCVSITTPSAQRPAAEIDSYLILPQVGPFSNTLSQLTPGESAQPAPALLGTDLPHLGISSSTKSVRIKWISLMAQIFTEHKPRCIYCWKKNNQMVDARSPEKTGSQR